mmetsp:Transcript_11198/g.18830  ORF Transcript_11198/g.18830 Transcript_11198/m.18830 type:complete len:140 (+) Transcript_11198:1019-1438(+)
MEQYQQNISRLLEKDSKLDLQEEIIAQISTILKKKFSIQSSFQRAHFGQLDRICRRVCLEALSRKKSDLLNQYEIKRLEDAVQKQFIAFYNKQLDVVPLTRFEGQDVEQLLSQALHPAAIAPPAGRDSSQRRSLQPVAD